MRMSKGNITIFFIPKSKVPSGRTVAYGLIVTEIQPQKDKTHCTWLTIGGNRIHFPGDITKLATDIKTSKLLFNSVISIPNSKTMCDEISNLYFNNPVDRYYYMKLTLGILSQTKSFNYID